MDLHFTPLMREDPSKASGRPSNHQL